MVGKKLKKFCRDTVITINHNFRNMARKMRNRPKVKKGKLASNVEEKVEEGDAARFEGEEKPRVEEGEVQRGEEGDVPRAKVKLKRKKLSNFCSCFKCFSCLNCFKLSEDKEGEEVEIVKEGEANKVVEEGTEVTRVIEGGDVPSVKEGEEEQIVEECNVQGVEGGTEVTRVIEGGDVPSVKEGEEAQIVEECNVEGVIEGGEVPDVKQGEEAPIVEESKMQIVEEGIIEVTRDIEGGDVPIVKDAEEESKVVDVQRVEESTEVIGVIESEEVPSTKEGKEVPVVEEGNVEIVDENTELTRIIKAEQVQIVNDALPKVEECKVLRVRERKATQIQQRKATRVRKILNRIRKCSKELDDEKYEQKVRKILHSEQHFLEELHEEAFASPINTLDECTKIYHCDLFDLNSNFGAVSIEPKGNCFYNAVSYSLFKSEEFGLEMRLLCIHYILTNIGFFRQLTNNCQYLLEPEENTLRTILSAIATEYRWAKDVSLLALCLGLRREIFVIMPCGGVYDGRNRIVIYSPDLEPVQKPIVLLLQGNHYSTILPKYNCDEVLNLRSLANEIIKISNYLEF